MKDLHEARWYCIFCGTEEHAPGEECKGHIDFYQGSEQLKKNPQEHTSLHRTGASLEPQLGQYSKTEIESELGGAFCEILSELVEIFDTKQSDYGPENITRTGEFGVVVRASDKVERLLHLLGNGKEPNHETIEDSWKDLANYAVIGLMVHRGVWK